MTSPCPERIAEVIARILHTAVLRIRALGWSGDAAACSVEADHIHNLPDLLREFRPELLEYYLNVERTQFVAEARDTASFTAYWNDLESELQRLSKK